MAQGKDTDETYQFKFSIVIAVYNVELFLEETVESVIEQNIGFKKNVQLVLVDDGSTDKSGGICDCYQRKYPENVVVVHKVNGGVSTARNEGLKHVRGEFVNFLDGDDKLSKNALKKVYHYFKKWEQAVDIVTIPLFFFDAHSGAHILNYKFDGGSRIIDLEEQYDCPLLSSSASFFKCRLFETCRFDENLRHGEDAKLVLEILQNRKAYGVVREAAYHYRRRSQGAYSALQKSLDSVDWYMDSTERFHLSVLRNYRERENRIPLFVQYALMYDMQWRFSSQVSLDDVLGEEQKETYISNLHEILNDIDEGIVKEQRNISRELQLSILKFKSEDAMRIKEQEEDIAFLYGDTEVLRYSDIAAVIEFFEWEGENLVLEGFMTNLDDVISSGGMKIFVKCNDDFYFCETYDRNYKKLLLGDPISHQIGFSVRIPIAKERRNSLSIYCEIKGKRIRKKNICFGKFAPLTQRLKNSYCISRGMFCSVNDGTILLQPSSPGKHIRREFCFLCEILSRRDHIALKAFVMRVLYHLFSSFTRGKDRWIISDRVERADDNGEAFFSYLMEEKITGPDILFAISKESPDYKRLKKTGKVIPFSGWRYKWYYLCGARIISSQAEEYVFHCFQGYSFYYYDLIQKDRFVFLQHGIIQNDLSDWLKKTNKNIKLFITSTNQEKESILNGDYGYGSDVVKLTGLPRHDRLFHDEKKYITILPTWRFYLVGLMDFQTGKRSANEEFADSLYNKMYSSLMTNSRLLEACQKMGYQIQFMGHPNMDETLKEMKIDKRVRVLKDVPYRQLFAESNLLITDYSSVAFDFACLRKPVLYFQEDKEEFYSGKHTSRPGYFDYERDGFGEVEYSVEDMVDRVIEYMQRDCKVKDEYLLRINQTFPFHDRENCKRVYEAVLEMEKRERRKE